MRSTVLAAAILVAGFGCSNSSKLEVTPEMEAEQKRNEKNVQDDEKAMRKQQKPSRSREDEVNRSEAEMQRKSSR